MFLQNNITRNTYPQLKSGVRFIERLKILYNIKTIRFEVWLHYEGKGYDIDELRAGDGTTLDELNYGNDITNLFVEEFENGKYERFKDTD